MNCSILAAALLPLGISAAYGDTTPPSPAHHTRSHYRTHAAHPAPATQSAKPPSGPPPVTTAETPAPVPNQNIGPPRNNPGDDTSINPGTLQLRYPGVGNGYLPGSSSTAVDNERAAKVPGVIAKVPIEPQAPPPLPPVQNGH